MHNEVKKNVILFESQLTKIDGIDVNLTAANGPAAGAGAGAGDNQPRAVRKETIQVVQQWLSYLDRLDTHLTALESFVEFLHAPHPTSVASNVVGSGGPAPPAPAPNGYARR